MRKIGRVNEKIDAARVAINGGDRKVAKSAMDKLMSVYSQEYPDQIFMKFKELEMGMKIMELTLDYHILMEDRFAAMTTMLGVKSYVDGMSKDLPLKDDEEVTLCKIRERCKQKYELFSHNMDNDPEHVADYDKVLNISEELIRATDAKDNEAMAVLIEELNKAYQTEYGVKLDGFKSVKTYFWMMYANIKCMAYNNANHICRMNYEEVCKRYDGMMADPNLPFSEEKIAELQVVKKQIDALAPSFAKDTKNMHYGREDCLCTLCRKYIANETGSHMVPNFLARITFAYDGVNRNNREALDFNSLNEPSKNASFYGREVPGERIEMALGHPYGEEDEKKNINLLMYDNLFCKPCEKRFSTLETVYAEYYAGRQAKVNPRIAYLFWLSVLWRMSIGSMGIFIKMEEELQLRKILNDGILPAAKDTAAATTDLGEWQYVVYQCKDIRNPDKGIFGCRREYAPYVITANDLVVVFFPKRPDKDQTIASLDVRLEYLQNWREEPKVFQQITRRQFWDVRDWMVETSYEYRDPAREKVLRHIREKERSEGVVWDEDKKQAAIDVVHFSEQPQQKMIVVRKLYRIFIAWMKQKEATEKGEQYDPLQDEDLFLQQKDFDNYYDDLLTLSREGHEVTKYPFYEEALKRHSDPSDWEDPELRELEELLKPQEPYVNPFKGIGRNDPCPCGSGKKFKKCCGRNL